MKWNKNRLSKYNSQSELNYIINNDEYFEQFKKNLHADLHNS